MFTEWLWMAFPSITFQGSEGLRGGGYPAEIPHLGQKQQHGSLQKSLLQGQPGPSSSCHPCSKPRVGLCESPLPWQPCPQGRGMLTLACDLLPSDSCLCIHLEVTACCAKHFFHLTLK